VPKHRNPHENRNTRLLRVLVSELVACEDHHAAFLATGNELLLDLDWILRIQLVRPPWSNVNGKR
jgi:hypothetical protein